MCGIAGVLYSDSDRPVLRESLKHMGDAIALRGPDGEGFYRSGNFGMVHRRLSIIDLEGGSQPIGNEDGSIQVVFNGEIYNYRELRAELESQGHLFKTNSDTEVLVHLFEEYGPHLCTRLRGMFSFALWNSRSRQLMLARDHLGQKPLFIYRDGEKLLFGSELKALFAHGEVERTISPEAIEDYLTFGFIPGQRSILQRVQKLPAGHWMLVSTDRMDSRPQRYWELSFSTEVHASEDEWKDRIDEAIRSSVKAHLIADVPVGAFLSGGLDSSAIVATVSGLLNEPLQTFSIGFQEKKFSELPYAESVAHHFGCLHTEEIVTPEATRDLEALTYLYDEPFADASAIPTMAVARMASNHVKVALSGDGGDELFGGYARYSHDLKEAALRDRLPAWLRMQILGRMAAVWPKADWLPRPLRLQTLLQNLSSEPAVAYANTVSTCRRAMRSQLLNPQFAARLANHHPESLIEDGFRKGHRDVLSGMLSADTAVLLPDDFLTKVDRASMGFGLEVRPPLIDWQLMELAASMPSSMKVRNGSKKWILKQIFESRLPDKLVHRRKQGFELPTDAWMRGPLKDQIHQLVLSPSASIAEYIDVKRASRLFADHCRGRGRYGQLLWSLLVLGCWLNTWGKGITPTPPESGRRKSRAEGDDALTGHCR
ncbi:MAG: asparagine synthase (glutamine-hydrolyzing) [Planctomycetaceae bacterium]|nr:asparagine synthase (glutamine-hydrolyzing) [Planctomycetaceae bacterium]